MRQAPVLYTCPVAPFLKRVTIKKREKRPVSLAF